MPDVVEEDVVGDLGELGSEVADRGAVSPDSRGLLALVEHDVLLFGSAEGYLSTPLFSDVPSPSIDDLPALLG